jgi:hypothetical protein
MKDAKLNKWIDWVIADNELLREAVDATVITEEQQSSTKPTPVNRQDKHAEWNIPIPRNDNEKQTALDEMNKRHANAQNLFTGEPLEGQDLKDWELLERQRAYSLETE